MEVNNNLNSMYQLESQLNKSADNISKLNATDHGMKNDEVNNVLDPNINLAEEMVNQITIPIAYTANAEVISTQASLDRTVLDIKA